MTLMLAQSETGLALVLTLVGMGVVFAALIVLMVMVAGLQKALAERPPKASPTPPATTAPSPAGKPADTAAPQPVADDEQLVAVLAAAAAAALNTSASNVRIIRFQRWSGEWSAFGRVNLTQSHRPNPRPPRTLRR